MVGMIGIKFTNCFITLSIGVKSSQRSQQRTQFKMEFGRTKNYVFIFILLEQ